MSVSGNCEMTFLNVSAEGYLLESEAMMDQHVRATL